MVKVTSSDSEKGRFIAGPWSPNVKPFSGTSDSNREYATLAFYDLDKSKLEWVLTPTPEHDIESVDLSSDGKTLVWTENVDGYS
jgi:hypothetical protein